MSSVKYQRIYDRMTEIQKQIMADLYMKGINHDGHSWNTYGDIEDAVADLLENTCEWIKYDYRTMSPKNHGDVDNPYWRIPTDMKHLLYCPYCGKRIRLVD